MCLIGLAFIRLFCLHPAVDQQEQLTKLKLQEKLILRREQRGISVHIRIRETVYHLFEYAVNSGAEVCLREKNISIAAMSQEAVQQIDFRGIQAVYHGWIKIKNITVAGPIIMQAVDIMQGHRIQQKQGAGRKPLGGGFVKYTRLSEMV